METRLAQAKNYHMHIKEQKKDQTIFIKHNSCQSEKNTHM